MSEIKPLGPYSQTLKVGPFIFMSGQIGLDPATGRLAGEDLEIQLKQVFKNIESLLKEAGGEFKDIIKLTVFLVDISQFEVVNKMMAKVFVPPYPVRSTVEVSRLPKDAQIEIEVMASIP
jgi:2-iminobutanoate/2-iminopropanoate deaminase